MQVGFYHLTRDTPEQAIPRIAARVVEGGDRLLVVSADAALLARIDETLWTRIPDSFLAHGHAGDEHEAAQPILLGATADAPNGAAMIAIADGVWREEALGFARAFYFFDKATIQGARAAWRALGEKAEVERTFWKQDGGKWVEGP